MSGSKTAIGVIAGVVLIAAIGGGAFVYVNRAPAANALSTYATGALAKLEVPAKATPAPDYVFRAADGADARFDQFRGKVVVVNLWAMWCAPCRAEMPTLARLASTYAARGVVVVPINVDVTAENLTKAPTFLADNAPLTFYSDPKFELPFRFVGKGGMPQTILLDRKGRVRAALTGGGDWNSPEAHAVIDALLAESD
jgi:thiol-disulfide isomerase/thioredoxin